MNQNDDVSLPVYEDYHTSCTKHKKYTFIWKERQTLNISQVIWEKVIDIFVYSPFEVQNITSEVSKYESCRCHGSQRHHEIWYRMMTSSNRNFFRVTGLLWGEFTGHRWIPLTKVSDAELWCFLWSATENQLSKQSKRWLFEAPSGSLWCHCNGLDQCGGWFCQCIMRLSMDIAGLRPVSISACHYYSDVTNLHELL